MWPIYLAIVVLYTAGYTIYLQLSFVLAGDHVTSPALQSRIFAVGTAVHFFGGLFYGRIAQRLGRRWMLVLTLGLMATSDLIVGATSNLAWIVVASGFAGLGGGNLVIYANNLILDRAPIALRGKALGFMVMAMYIGDFLNPWVVTPLRGAIGNHNAFAVIGTMVLLGALTAAFARRAAVPRAELAA
jgi:MFS family permease